MGSVFCSNDNAFLQKIPPTNLSIEKLIISLDGKEISTEDLQKQKCTEVNYKFTEDINQLSPNYYKKYCNVTYRKKSKLKKSSVGSMKGNTNLAIDCLTLFEQARMQTQQKIKINMDLLCDKCPSNVDDGQTE
eukprot:9096800-Ditylum_brightwellii.AAC.1